MFSRTTLLSLPVAAVLAVAVATPASAAPAPAVPTAAQPAASTVSAAAPSRTIATVTDSLARALAHTLRSSTIERRVTAEVSAGPVDLAAIQPNAAFTRSVTVANRAVLAAKGLPADTGSVLQVRLADPAMRAALAEGVQPVVAATPSDDSVATFTSYTAAGATVTLGAASVPARPVLLVEVNTAKAETAGLAVMRKTFATHGVSAPNAVHPADAGGYWTTKIDSVWLNDDEEPWFKGAAEIYSIVGGFDLGGAATVNIVQMPYLDDDHTTYYPNQILVSYNNYKYNLADVVMMEDDGDTNYASLAAAITTALLTIVDEGVTSRW